MIGQNLSSLEIPVYTAVFNFKNFFSTQYFRVLIRILYYKQLNAFYIGGGCLCLFDYYFTTQMMFGKQFLRR